MTAGTIFQDTRKPLRLWFRAIWHVTSQKNGASALGLQRVLGLGSAPATDREYTEPTPSIEKMGCRLCRRPRERNQELFEGRADPEADIATDAGAGVKEAEMNRLRFGPGLLVTAAFIGPGTLVTASRAGAGYGVTLLWAILFSVAATAIIQDMAARVGLGDMEGFDVAEMGDADGLRPSGEAAGGGGVGLAGVRVPDVGGEELEDALGGGRVGREEGGELDTAAWESYRRRGSGLGNQCRVVGHEGPSRHE